MGLLDPHECIAARDCIKRGQAEEAAQLLLNSPHRQHRSVRRLLLEVRTLLVEKAHQFWEKGHLKTAREYILLAEKCAALQGGELALRDEILAAYEAEKARADWSRQQLAQAEQLAHHGHLRTALRLAENLRSIQAKHRCEVWEKQLERFEQYVADCRRYLEEQKYSAAYEAYRRARSILPDDPEVKALQEELGRRAPKPFSAYPSESGARPPTSHGVRWPLGQWAVVITADEIPVGCDSRVLLPVYGRVHSRHALFIRTKGGWQLAPLRNNRGETCFVRVNGSLISGPVILTDPSEIEFAPGGRGWRFCQPIAGSGTALLHAHSGNLGLALTSSGTQRCVILMADDLRVSPSAPAHFVLPDLPCRLLRFSRLDNGIGYEAVEGYCRLESPEGVPLPLEGQQITFPCRVVIESRLSEAERLGRMFMHSAPNDFLTINLEIV